MREVTIALTHRARELVGEFVRYCNEERLHQGIGFVTPAERREGRDVALLEVRKLGLFEARRKRPTANLLTEIRDQHPDGHKVEESQGHIAEGSNDRLMHVSA